VHARERARRHTIVGNGVAAQCAAADCFAESRADRQRRRVDHHQRLVVGGAQPHQPAAGVDIAPFEIVADLGAARDGQFGRIDLSDRAVALLLHPHRALAGRQEPGRIAKRDRADHGVGGRIDLLQHLALAAHRPDRIEAGRQIPGRGRHFDGRDDSVGLGIDPRDGAGRIARDPDRSGAGHDIGLALGIGEAAGNLGFERGGLEVDAVNLGALAIGDPQGAFGNRHRPARARHVEAGEFAGDPPLLHPPVIGDPCRIAVNRDEIGKAGNLERLFDQIHRRAFGWRQRLLGGAGCQQGGCHDQREEACCRTKGHRNPFQEPLAAKFLARLDDVSCKPPEGSQEPGSLSGLPGFLLPRGGAH
jgi:hypothetical protein